ncbi:MAG: hypothetical protein DMD43_02905 [Gemmatimonadetes bacterium]|nr:MAG: hypothetical protein DMD43_02905 [Gemmatimonadota bacterium]
MAGAGEALGSGTTDRLGAGGAGRQGKEDLREWRYQDSNRIPHEALANHGRFRWTVRHSKP